jgi:hypothetical protein
MIARLLAVLVLGLVAAPAAALDLSKISSNLILPELDDAALKARGLERVMAGDLTLPDGALAAMDPLVMPERPVLTRRVKPGTYPVEALRLLGGDPRNAMLIIRFSQWKAERWELAFIAGQDIATLRNDEFFGIPVDAGTAAFASSGFAKAVSDRETQEKTRNKDYSNYYDDVLASEMVGERENLLRHQPLPDRPEAAAIIAGSGWGDGFYPVIFGLDTSGDPAFALIDFYVAIDGHARDVWVRREERIRAVLDAELPRWRAMLVCSKGDAALNDHINQKWREERGEVASALFGTQLPTAFFTETVRRTDPARLIAEAPGASPELERYCAANGEWRDLAIGTHQSDPSRLIIRILSEP